MMEYTVDDGGHSEDTESAGSVSEEDITEANKPRHYVYTAAGPILEEDFNN